MSSGILRIHRPSAFVDYFRSYKVMIDGACVGRIKRGETFETSLPAGQYDLRLDIDWCSSNSVRIMIDGGVCSFLCGGNHGGWKLLSAWKILLAPPKEYLWLKPEAQAGIDGIRA